MKTFIRAFALLIAACASTYAAEDSWPQFRGPNCSGVSETAHPPTEFGPDKNVRWKVALPGGSSSPVVWGDRIFLTAFNDGKLEIHCYARKDGKLIWKHAVPVAKLEEFHVTEGTPAASSCATDGKHVVSYFGSYGLICHDFNGKELWKHPLPIAQTPGGFGTGNSPTIAGNLVVLNRDMMKGCSLLAVNLQTGKTAWETPRPDVGPSFGSTTFWKHDGLEEIVMSGSLKMKAYDPETGKERWSLAGLPSFTCTTAVTGDDMVFFAGWSPGKGDSPMPTFKQMAADMDKNHDNAITPDEAKGTWLETFFRAQDINGDGRLTVEDTEAMKAMMARGENVLLGVKPNGEVAWKQMRGLPYVPSPLYYQGRVYTVKDGGMVSSYDAKTGKIAYQQERINAIGSYYASPVAADGKIIVVSMNGKVTMFAAGGDMPKILHQADFKERISATPALVGNNIYLRTPTMLYAFGE